MPISKTFKRKNIPCQTIKEAKEWIRNNPNLARRKPEANDWYEIEVFSYLNHKEVANDLDKVLKESGFLEKYPLFGIKIDPM